MNVCHLPSAHLSLYYSNNRHCSYAPFLCLSRSFCIQTFLFFSCAFILFAMSSRFCELERQAQLNSDTSAELTATASDFRGASGCIPLHRDLQVRCCACQRRISRREIVASMPNVPKKRLHVELGAASSPQTHIHRVEGGWKYEFANLRAPCG